MPRPRSANTRQWKQPSLASRIAAARLVAEQFRELARIAGEGTHHHTHMLARARAWQAKATRLAGRQNTGMPEKFTLSAS